MLVHRSNRILHTVEPVKVEPNVRMLDLALVLARYQIAFRDIGRLVRVVHQHTVPRLVSWRFGDRHLLIPVFAQSKFAVTSIDNASIGKSPMLDDLPNMKFGRVWHRVIIRGVNGPPRFLG